VKLVGHPQMRVSELLACSSLSAAPMLQSLAFIKILVGRIVVGGRCERCARWACWPRDDFVQDVVQNALRF
jgi:hypothetical protein